MGYSLRRLMLDVEDLGLEGVEELERLDDMAFPTAFAFAAVRWGIPPRMALGGYVWSWLENQVMAALKAVPLGQTDGQRLLAKLGARIPAVCNEAVTMADEDLSNFMPGLAILSSVHETQYSRLFRS
jgi:urease accessory protein